jgi:hypothetical protein
MIFWRLVGQKYLAYLAAVSLLLGSLYTLVEVLEKLARYQNIAINRVLHYACVAFIPSFILLFPISALLSSALFLREWLLRGHLVSMLVYGIAPRQVVAIVGLSACLAAAGLFVLHELVGYRLARHMAQTKVLLLHREASINGWLRSGPTTFVLGLGNKQSYVLEGGATPSLSIITGFMPMQQGGNALRVRQLMFQKEEIITIKNAWIDTSRLDILTYATVEQSYFYAVRSLPTLYGQRLVVDLLYFFLKIILLPFFAISLFFVWQKWPKARWVGVAASYFLVGAGHACTQLLGPLVGFLVLIVMLILLGGYFFAMRI